MRRCIAYACTAHFAWTSTQRCAAVGGVCSVYTIILIWYRYPSLVTSVFKLGGSTRLFILRGLEQLAPEEETGCRVWAMCNEHTDTCLRAPSSLVTHWLASGLAVSAPVFLYQSMGRAPSRLPCTQLEHGPLMVPQREGCWVVRSSDAVDTGSLALAEQRTLQAAR